MYTRINNDGTINKDFVDGVENFISFACNQLGVMNVREIRCPCRKCHNRKFQTLEEVKLHLFRKGFIADYYVWDRHGEQYVHATSTNFECNIHEEVDTKSSNPYRQLIIDAARPGFNVEDMEEVPNPTAQKFYDMLNAVDEKLWYGCTKHSQMSAVARLLHMKSEHHFSERCFDYFTQFLQEVLLEDNKMVDNFYRTKKLVQGLGLPVEKIDCCKNSCVIYWGEDADLTSCKFCNHPRFKNKRDSGKPNKYVPHKMMYYFPLSPRLQRLYASEATTAHMRWHDEHQQDDGTMCHPSDSEAWKHFNRTHPSFSCECRNVRLGLCTDGFQPFGQSGQQYSSWPVIVTPYNLPSWMCMKEAYMFLSVILPGPNNPKNKIDVFLQPLIAELKQLWDVGVQTYDVSRKQNFQMRAALMWTISDFPAYSMLSGWSTAEKLACPYCMEHSQAFTLTSGRKTSWFDNHRKFITHEHPFRRNKNAFIKNRTEMSPSPPIKTGAQILPEIDNLGVRRVIDIDVVEVNRVICKTCGWNKRSIFWELPYWSSNLIRHNLDVMHIEKNVFENVFNTVLDIEGKTKDNEKAREDMKRLCRRHELERDEATGKFPKACYTLDKARKQVLCEWVKNLKFPDGYASNMGRCVDMRKLKLFGMKSHDCHVFMQRLLLGLCTGPGEPELNRKTEPKISRT